MKTKLWFEDQHWIRVQQEFSQFVQNLSEQLCEEGSIHSKTKRNQKKKEQITSDHKMKKKNENTILKINIGPMLKKN